MGVLIDVKSLVNKTRKELSLAIEKLKTESNTIPKIVVILVGDNPASLSYVKGKQKVAAELGMVAEVIKFAKTVTAAELILTIKKVNQDRLVHGIIVQLPLPQNLDETAILETICLEKDVDGFLPENLGRMMIGKSGFVPCTPKGIIAIIQSEGVDMRGKHVVVVGRSNIVGKPIALLALQHDATVTITHSQTKNLVALTKMADILIVAVGRANFIGAEHVKSGAMVIDVGVNLCPQTGKLVGDVNAFEVLPIAAKLTPVPGGVGPMTITMLLSNTILATQRQVEKGELSC
ncbi:MAG: bifunctional 5,10-methylenetetrahydrofolate dehydrogenase/5,10-methenyltetrahydrofolate cyclohydrolase [Culicoidibacterales bacterium]